MPSYEIIGSEKVFSSQPSRQGQVDRVVLYRGEDQVTRFVTIPDETFSLQNAQEAIRKFEAERRLTTPHRFTL